MARIAVIGSLNMDLVVRAPRIPEPGETILGAFSPGKSVARLSFVNRH